VPSKHDGVSACQNPLGRPAHHQPMRSASAQPPRLISDLDVDRSPSLSGLLTNSAVKHLDRDFAGPKVRANLFVEQAWTTRRITPRSRGLMSSVLQHGKAIADAKRESLIDQRHFPLAQP
jgi:hypothetical protein